MGFEVGQPQVEQDQVGLEPLGGRDCRGGGSDVTHQVEVEAAGEGQGHQQPVIGVVVDDEQSHDA